MVKMKINKTKQKERKRVLYIRKLGGRNKYLYFSQVESLTFLAIDLNYSYTFYERKLYDVQYIVFGI